jgi:two-component system response regulator NreC
LQVVFAAEFLLGFPVEAPPVKIVVIEDQTMIRDLLVWACRSAFAPAEIGQAGDGASALKQCEELRPDLIILDLELPDMDGLDLLPELRRLSPGAKIIALSTHTDDVTVHRVIQARIEGFVDKNAQPMDVLREAVATVMDGRQYFSPVIREVRLALRNAPAAFNKLLTDREQEVLGQIGLGLTNDEIADQLGLRVVTVQNHRSNIMNKLGLHSSSHLIRYAIEKGFTRIRRLSPASS